MSIIGSSKYGVVQQRIVLLALLCLILLASRGALAADVLIVGDIQYRQVADVSSEIRATLRSQVKEYGTSEARGKLERLVEREDARVVVALGLEAVTEALRLPANIPVVFGLIIAPPKSSRPNVTGVYMSTPVSEYIATARKSLPMLSRFSVIGSSALMHTLLSADSHATAYRVSTPPELMNTVNRLSDTHALLLLPDANLLTASVMENVFLFSFRKNIPVLGVSESNVKQGALFALVFDPKGMGRQIGEKVHRIIQGVQPSDIPISPPHRFNLFINTNTARKMDIAIPDDLLKKARKVYP